MWSHVFFLEHSVVFGVFAEMLHFTINPFSSYTGFNITGDDHGMSFLHNKTYISQWHMNVTSECMVFLQPILNNSYSSAYKLAF